MRSHAEAAQKKRIASYVFGIQKLLVPRVLACQKRLAGGSIATPLHPSLRASEQPAKQAAAAAIPLIGQKRRSLLPPFIAVFAYLF